MNTKPLRDWLEPGAPEPRWEWPTADHPPLPAMGERALFITEESAAQVANVFSPTDVDESGDRTLEIVSRAPTVDPAEKWEGDDSSDP